MSIARAVLIASLLTVAFVAVSPALAPAAAQPDNVYVCVIGVADGCPPGHLAEIHVKGNEVDVPDPCYTTSCV